MRHGLDAERVGQVFGGVCIDLRARHGLEARGRGRTLCAHPCEERVGADPSELCEDLGQVSTRRARILEGGPEEDRQDLALGPSPVPKGCEISRRIHVRNSSSHERGAECQVRAQEFAGPSCPPLALAGLGMGTRETADTCHFLRALRKDYPSLWDGACAERMVVIAPQARSLESEELSRSQIGEGDRKSSCHSPLQRRRSPCCPSGAACPVLPLLCCPSSFLPATDSRPPVTRR